jgi:hypothetical protein
VKDTQPTDFVTLQQWCAECGGKILGDWKTLHYHTKPIQRELIDAGAMARIGRLVFVHKSRFWNAFQAIQIRKLEEGQ